MKVSCSSCARQMAEEGTLASLKGQMQPPSDTKRVYSPHHPVFGYDTTYIRRKTLAEYERELEAESTTGATSDTQHAQKRPASASSSAHQGGGPKERRVGLAALNPNITFFSKYPVHDRLGRELCVAHQIQDAMVQQELRRLEAGWHSGHDCRRSGVRLSAELPLGSDGTATCPCSVVETQPPSPAESRENAFARDALRAAQASPVDDDDDSVMDVEVSATSNYASVSASRTSSRPASARPSEFSIFRESGAAVAVRAADAARKARSTIPVRAVAEEEKILLRGGAGGGGQRAASMPFSAGDGAGGTAMQGRGWRLGGEKRHRSDSAGGRLSRVRFISEGEADVEEATAHGRVSPGEGERKEHQAPSSATPVLPPRLKTPPPMPLSDADARPPHDAEMAEATRWTTLARGSAAVRATKQLFSPSTQSANASRMTTTLNHPHPIPSNVYGFTAPAIAMSKVCDAVEQNVVACTTAMPQHYTEGFGGGDEGEVSRQHTPELQFGSVVRLGDHHYRLVRFYAVAEVFEAVRVSAPASGDAPRNVEGEPCQEADGCVPSKPREEEQRAASLQANEDACRAEAAMAHEMDNTSAEQAPPTAGHEGAAAPPQLQQIFVYRWRSTDAPYRRDEARRAALGLSLCAPHAQVTGYRYADGGGVTLVTLPAGHHAVPLSTVPLSLRSFTTLLRIVLKALSSMVARRTVHGSLAALGELFAVWPGEESGEPYVITFHWERWVDFGMFVDRNAGRTLPLDLEDGTAQPLVLHGKDLLAGLQLFLEHPLAAQLSSEQYILLQKLVVLAAEPTPVAIHLIQLKNLMLTLPADTAALDKSIKGALEHNTDA